MKANPTTAAILFFLTIPIVTGCQSTQVRVVDTNGIAITREIWCQGEMPIVGELCIVDIEPHTLRTPGGEVEVPSLIFMGAIGVPNDVTFFMTSGAQMMATRVLIKTLRATAPQHLQELGTADRISCGFMETFSEEDLRLVKNSKEAGGFGVAFVCFDDRYRRYGHNDPT